MEKFIHKNKGPLIATASAAVGLILLLLVSAVVNLPQTTKPHNGGSGMGIFWLLLITGWFVVAFIFIKKRLGRPEGVLLTMSAKGSDQLVQIRQLFGTTDMKQITTGIQAMYAELEEWRTREDSDQPDLTTKLRKLEKTITALTSERDQAQLAGERWQAKAISSTQEVDALRQEIQKYGKWQLVSDEDLAAFFPTVTIKDGSKDNAFLDAKRRQRRLTQRLSAEEYFIVQKAD